MSNKIKILHLEDAKADAELVARELKKGNLNTEILVVPDKIRFVEALQTFAPDIILSDHSMAAFDSHEAIRIVKKYGVNVPFILVTSTMSDDFAAKVMKEGACDYILKDRLHRLPSAIVNSIENQRLQDQQRIIHEKLVFHIDNTPLGFIEFDNRMRLKSISIKAEKLFGWNLREYSSDDLNIYSLVHYEDWDWLSSVLKQLIIGESERNVIYIRNCTKQGEILWCEWFISVMKHGDEVTFMTLIQDITNSKIFEKKLFESDASLKEAQGIAHIGSWEIDLQNKAALWSDELYNIFELHDKPTPSPELFSYFIHPEDLTYCKDLFEKIEDNEIDYRLLLDNGAVKYVFNKWRFEFNDQNQPVRLYGILQDITERKLAEMERINLVNDLIDRNTELEQFAYIISHNLRSPIANIIGASNALEDPELTDEDKEILNKGINVSVRKLDAVVVDLNHILQVKGAMTDFKELVNFTEMVKDIEVSIANLIFESDIEIKYDFDEINEIFTLKPYLYSVFFNLISNSVKYRKQQSHCLIEIKSRMANNTIELIFTDNGMGIDLMKQGDHVFGLYKRFHRNIEGKGMGLFMVKTQVRTLGGKISIQSTVGQGTEFTIQLNLEHAT
jgi:PAS domain S-box-containing protein